MTELEDVLRACAREWLATHGDPWPDGSYSTSGNHFLHLAESAFAAELMAVRAAVPVEPVPPREGFHLYRLWAADGRLLYVGVSTRLRNRLKTHRRRWGDLIATVTWEEHPDAASMLDAERIAVRDEHPALNKALV